MVMVAMVEDVYGGFKVYPIYLEYRLDNECWYEDSIIME